MEKRRGHYMGTELDEKWYRRYKKEGFFARGLGDWWIENNIFRFHRIMLKKDLEIPLARVRAIELGRWHGGQWAGRKRVLKFIWEHEGRRLSSGFVLTRSSEDAARLREELERQITAFTE
ncbi:hypothetical protein GF420_16295 [candidate division GN15 bacterium]|nr:hypothetical protein [candidate division GN15 bacterium]